jgi:hypothetical protein
LDSFRIFYDFFKQNPHLIRLPWRHRWCHCDATYHRSSMTSHRAYPQNDPGVARNLQAKFGADRCSRWWANSEHTDTRTDPQTFGFIDKILI